MVAREQRIKAIDRIAPVDITQGVDRCGDVVDELAVTRGFKVENTNQVTISQENSFSNILIAQSSPSSITRTINGEVVTAYALYRYYSSSGSDHFYTTNFDELGFGRSGYSLEGIAAYISTQSYSGTIPLYRAYSSSASNHFYTTNLAELVAAGGLGYVYEGVAGYVYSIPVTGTVPLYRYYSSSGTDHFYTTNFSELGAGGLGYVFEGIAGYVIPN